MAAVGSTGVNLPADIVLTPDDGSGAVYLMLAPTETAKKAWQMTEVPAPEGVRVTSQGAALQDLPPEMAATVYRTDNFQGMGPNIISVGGFNYMSGSVQTSVSGKILQPPYTEEIVVSEGTEGITAMTTYNGSLYVADGGGKVFRSDDGLLFYETLDTGGLVVTQLLTYGADDGDPGIIACVAAEDGTPSPYYFSLTGSPTAWTQVSGGTYQSFNYMVSAGGQLWGLVNPATVVTTTDPYEDSPIWSGATTVGDTMHDFRGAVSVSNFLIIFKEDVVWSISAGGVVTRLITQFESTPGEDNFEAFSAGWNANIYFTVDQEVWEYDPASGNTRSLNIYRLPDSQLDATSSTRQGITYDREGLYSIHQTNLGDTPGSSILRTDFFPDGSFAHERWVLSSASGYRPQGAMLFTRTFTELGTGRHVFFALHDPTGNNTYLKIGRVTIPRASDPTRDSASEYSVVDSVYRSGWMHHNFPAQFKDYTEVLLDLKGLSSVPPTSSVSVYYYLDGDLSTRYTLRENLDNDGLISLEFASGITARSFMLELVLHGDDVSNTPQVLSWNVKAAVKFDFREVFTLVVRVGDRISMRNRRRSSLSAKELRQRIRQLRAANNIRIRYQDYRGYDFTNVRILTGITELDQVDDEDRTNETMMTIRIMRVSEPFLHQFIVEQSVIASTDVIGESTT